MDKTLKEKIYDILLTYGGRQVEDNSSEIVFKDGLCFILNYLNLIDEIKRLEKYEITNLELKACLDFANAQIKENSNDRRG